MIPNTQVAITTALTTLKVNNILDLSGTNPKLKPSDSCIIVSILWFFLTTHTVAKRINSPLGNIPRVTLTDVPLPAILTGVTVKV